MNDSLRSQWQARANEPGFAIALALLEVADSIERLGFNYASPSKDKPGPIEKIAIILDEGLTLIKSKE